MENINLTQLTPEQLQQLEGQIKAKEAAAAQSRLQNIDNYKRLVGETVVESFPHLENLSTVIAATKDLVRSNFDAVLEFKAELYGIKEGQQSHQFTNDDDTLRIRIGYNMVDSYDDTVETGIAMVRAYISSLATDEKSQNLVDMVSKLLAKDNKGTLKASRVLQLQQMADKIQDAQLSDGVKIIRDAYKPVQSKSYIRAEYKNEKGVWISLPLGVTEAQ